MLKRIAGWTILIMMLVALCVFVFTPNAPEQSVSLRDGKSVSLVALAYGTNPAVLIGKPYQRFLYRISPNKLKPYSGAEMLISLTTSPTNCPVVWLRVSNPKQTPFFESHPVFRFLDEYGNECDEVGFDQGYSAVSNDGYIFYFHELIPDPHGKIVGICVYDAEDSYKMIGKLMFPDSFCQKLPENFPQQVPPPGKDDDLGFQVTSFITGLKAQPYVHGALTNNNTYSLLTTRVLRNGVRDTNWVIGNVWFPGLSKNDIKPFECGLGIKDGDDVMNMGLFLEPKKGPYKMTVQFLNRAAISPEDIITVKDIPCPSAGESLPLNFETMFKDRKLIITHIYGPDTRRPKGTSLAYETVVEVKLIPGNYSDFLKLIGAVDESANEVTRGGGIVIGEGEFQVNVAPRPGTKSISLSFAIQKSRFIEFEATPVLFSTNVMANK